MQLIHAPMSGPVARGIALLAFTLILTSTILPDVAFADAANSEQRIVRVGFVSPYSPLARDQAAESVFWHAAERAFWGRLRELGWIEGQNLAVESRWAEGRVDRFPALMAEVVARKVDVLVTYTTPGAIAAKTATSTIPIVDLVMGDPIGAGLVTDLARPGANLTGLSQAYSEDVAGKWLELLQETVPRLSTLAIIANPDNPISRVEAHRLEVIAPTRGLKARIVAVRTAQDLNPAFQHAGRIAQAVFVYADINLTVEQKRVIALAAKHRLPDMHIQRDFVEAGALMSYGPDYDVMFRRGAEYVDKILKGATAGDLPIEQPSRFELVVNLKRAQALGLKIPESILLRADKVIK
jgi:putative ABC transport system substrate-binding protein